MDSDTGKRLSRVGMALMAVSVLYGLITYFVFFLQTNAALAALSRLPIDGAMMIAWGLLGGLILLADLAVAVGLVLSLLMG
jgi:hypothetical protein